MKFEQLIHDSLVTFLVDRLAEEKIPVEEGIFFLGAKTKDDGTPEHCLIQLEVTEDDGHPDFHVHEDASGLTFVVKKGTEEFFNDLEIKCIQVDTEEGVKPIITFQPRVDSSEESDTIEE